MILGHGGDVFFFLLRRSFFGRKGGKNKEESKIVNGSWRYKMGLPTLAMLWFFGEAILEARNC